LPNITLDIDDDTLRKARKIAVDRHTTVASMIREFLRSLVASSLPDRERAVGKLTRTFDKLSRDMGGRTWSRASLHER
jgi:hypothetical protein